MVKRLILHEALGEDPNHIEPIVDGLLNKGVNVLLKKKSVSHIVHQILENKKLEDEREVPIIEISKKLQHFITAIRVVYSKDMRQEILGRFVPTLFSIINQELGKYGYAIKILEHSTIINSRRRVKLIQTRHSKKKKKNKS
ncbi:hypothetical protein KBD33_05550 [Candidatus Gracilibacteria bacterium]|nr:hypothetical protein [Candidatus Gracilibacteria bacterium]